MKKILLSVIALFVAISMNAEPYKVQAEDGFFNLASSSNWGGHWYAFATEGTEGNFDASQYEYVWIKFSGNTGKFRFAITYNEWKSTEAWGETFYDTTNIVEDAEGISYIKLEKDKKYEFGGPDKAASAYAGDSWDKHVQNVFTQDDGPEVSVTVEGIYFGTAAELEALLGGGGEEGGSEGGEEGGSEGGETPDLGEPYAVPADAGYFDLTSSSNWGGHWFDLGEDGNLNFDASAYDYAWCKFSGNTGKFRFGLTYSEWKSTEAWGETYYDAMVTPEEAEGIAYIKIEKEKTYEFDINKADNPYKGDTWDKHLRQIWTQDDGPEVSVKIEGIWFGTAEQLEYILNGGETAIQNVKAATAKDGVRYNLAGQKVNASYKGVVIMNGKKFLQK